MAALHPGDVLIVGLGNPLCGDDGFGEQVLRELSGAACPAWAADHLWAHTDLLGYLHRFEAYRQVVLLDTVLDPGSAGQVQVFEEEALERWPQSAASAHQVSPMVAVGLFRRLFPAAETRIVLVGLCSGELRLGQPTFGPQAVSEAMRLIRGTTSSERLAPR